MLDIKERIRNKKLYSKIVMPEEAAAVIKPGANIGTSGFTPAGYPKAVPIALAQRIRKEKFKINLWTGASVGKELDGALAVVNGIAKRGPYQSNERMRKRINTGRIQYIDQHLSLTAQESRYGFLCGGTDVAIIEACAITKEGNIIPTTSVGNAPSYVKSAGIVIVEINTSQPLELEGMHDIYMLADPPERRAIPITTAGERIGTRYIPCGLDKIDYIVACDIPDDVRGLAPIDNHARAMSGHLIEFFENEIKTGRLPETFLPLQSGVGSVANAVIAGFANSPFEDLDVYTEVIQDGMLDLIDAGKLSVASGTSLTPSPEGLKRFYNNLSEYRRRIILRPQEISNNPAVIRRLGVIAMNTALELDIYGNVNSTHVMGTNIMNGIGGSGDFARSAYLTIFCTNSTAKGGKISSIVPFCSHIDHTEHDIDIFVTEQGLADVRGLSPKERARVIIQNCAHPDYKPMLWDYLTRAEKATRFAQTPHILSEALSWHIRFMETGTMKM
jgi:succinyl-CoA:acetate CoA-transferase